MELFTFARSECLPSEPCSTGSTYAHRIAHSQSLSACACYRTVGGDQGRVEIHLIAHPDDDQTEARRLLTEQFATFDAGKARCLLASDREHLLAVIEAGFGDFDDFNRIARSLLASRLHNELSSARSRRISETVTERRCRVSVGAIMPVGQ